jgi:MerR family transcriptional regulator/heat shock protein HspR
MTGRSSKKTKMLRISAVAARFDIHPQTLRLYEREGLISPPRSAGNTRLYDDETLERLETILNLTRELGVNLAGVEVILNMREQMKSLEIEANRLLAFVKREMRDRKIGVDRKYALVKIQSGPLAQSREDETTAETSAKRSSRRRRRR